MSIFGTLTTAAKWYVDSTNGSDANSGTLGSGNLPRPLQTIAALLTKTITSGDVIALASGSHWREELIVPTTVQLVAYGSGAKPILDASDVISPGAWSKTAGQTNVYQADSLPLEDPTAGNNFVNTWEAGTFLVRATSVANCDATAASYFPSSDGGASITIYVHTSDDSNPASNGRIYEYSRRSFGIQCYPPNCRFYGIETMKNLNLTGSMFLGYGGYMSNCQFSWGNKHCVLVQHGTLLEDCTALNSYFNSTDTMFVYYETVADTSMVARFTRCTATQAWQFRGSSVGFFGHAGSGLWGQITYQDCTSNSVGVAFSGGQSTNQVINNATVNEANTFVTVSTPTAINGGTVTMPIHGDSCIYCGTNESVTIRNLTAVGGKGGSGFIRNITETGVSADVQNCTISGFITCVQFFGPPVSLIFKSNNVQAASDFYFFGNQPTLTANLNTFTSPGSGIRAEISPNSYTYTQWKALGYDANSTP